MNALPHLGPPPQLGSQMPAGQTDFAVSTDLLSDQVSEALRAQWQAQLLSLQGCICELLIKNQQLRMTVMEMRAKKQEDESGSNGCRGDIR